MSPQRLSTQARAFAMAVLVTLTVLGGVNHLATSPAPAGLVAQMSNSISNG